MEKRTNPMATERYKKSKQNLAVILGLSSRFRNHYFQPYEMVTTLVEIC